MRDLELEWDDDKAEDNLRRHGVDFRDAVGVFFDPWAIEQMDEREHGEDRFQVIGVAQGRALLVVYAEREGRIRLICARRTTRCERRAYENTRK